MHQGDIRPIPAPCQTDELPVLDESDECTEIFSSAMFSAVEEPTSPSLPSFEVVAAPEPDAPTRPVPFLEPLMIPLPPVASFPSMAQGAGALPPPATPVLRPLPGLDFDDVTRVKPPVVVEEDEASPIPLLRRKSTPPAPPVQHRPAARRSKPERGFFARLLSLLCRGACAPCFVLWSCSLLR
jgi:hypothetical protein